MEYFIVQQQEVRAVGHKDHENMITMKTEVNVKGVVGKDIHAFMLNCTDEDYQKWWAGTHLAFHTVKRYPGDQGNRVYFDEYIGKHRLKFAAVLIEIIPDRKLVWQMKKMVRLPGWLEIELEDDNDGVRIIHSVSIGFKSIGGILDPILRLYFSQEFEKELEEHARIEFTKLAEMLA